MAQIYWGPGCLTPRRLTPGTIQQVRLNLFTKRSKNKPQFYAGIARLCECKGSLEGILESHFILYYLLFLTCQMEIIATSLPCSKCHYLYWIRCGQKRAVSSVNYRWEELSLNVQLSPWPAMTLILFFLLLKKKMPFLSEWYRDRVQTDFNLTTCSGHCWLLTQHPPHLPTISSTNRT